MQQVKVGDTCSDWQGARRGVLQGNVLAPMFFVIYFEIIYSYKLETVQLNMYGSGLLT